MCFHGFQKLIRVINSNQTKEEVFVDSCIAEEIQHLNNQGIVTISSCCGHGKAGQIVEYQNGLGKWKEYENPPHVLINNDSVKKAKVLGYTPFPYFYANGISNGTWQMILKSGCITVKDCEKWHKENKLPVLRKENP